MPSQSQLALDKDLATQSHADRFDSVEKPEIYQQTITERVERAKAIANKEHHCHTCKKNFDADWTSNRHNNSASHHRKEEAQALQ
jgi:hypothetical protein